MAPLFADRTRAPASSAPSFVVFALVCGLLAYLLWT
jgi:hypothetical protein